MKNSIGQFIILPLFYELATGDKKKYVQYTLKEEDYQGYPSLRRLYLETEDPTEYEFSQKYLWSWKHWKVLCSSPTIKPYIEEWREELEVKLQAQALAHLISSANSETDRNAYNANKFLMDKGWKDKKDQKITRTAKDKIKTEAARIIDIHEDVAADFETIIQGKPN
jgi:uncharacterized protein Usg